MTGTGRWKAVIRKDAQNRLTLYPVGGGGQQYRSREFRAREKRRGRRRIYRVKRSTMVDILSITAQPVAMAVESRFQSSRPETAIRSCRFFNPHSFRRGDLNCQGALG